MTSYPVIGQITIGDMTVEAQPGSEAIAVKRTMDDWVGVSIPQYAKPLSMDLDYGPSFNGSCAASAVLRFAFSVQAADRESAVEEALAEMDSWLSEWVPADACSTRVLADIQEAVE